MSDTRTITAEPKLSVPKAAEMSKNPKSSIEQLSVQLLEQTEKNSILENEMLKLKRKNEDLLKRIHNSRKQQEESDREVQKLSTEVEELSATLFDQANNKVKEANIQANDFKVRNGKLIESLKQKDMLIDVLKKELSQLKDMLSHMTNDEPKTEGESSSTSSEADKTLGSSVEERSLGDASFTTPRLQKFDGKVIYSPLYNQLRFDLHSFNQFRRALASTTLPFNIKDSSFFRTILAEDVEPVLRLDLSPGVKFYRRRSFILSLMDTKVTIEPLSASTEVWKSNNIALAALPGARANSTSSKNLGKSDKPDPKLFRYDTDRPVAVEERCSLCGEKRKEMSFARLYRLKIKDYAYTICISCANKLRCTVELLVYIKGLQKTIAIDEVASSWCKLTELRAKLYFTKFGLWSEADQFGLVYGWKNLWWNQVEGRQFSGSMSEISSSTRTSISGTDSSNENVKEVKSENEKIIDQEHADRREIETTKEGNTKINENEAGRNHPVVGTDHVSKEKQSGEEAELETVTNEKDYESETIEHNDYEKTGEKPKDEERDEKVGEKSEIEVETKPEEDKETIFSPLAESTKESERKTSSESEDAFNDAVE